MATNSPRPTNLATPDVSRVRKVEILISNLLRSGVAASVATVVVGTVLTFIHHPEYLTSHAELARLLDPAAVFPHTLGALVEGLRQFEGRAVVVLGLLMLVATPVMRVAVSIFAFVYQRDRVFVAITSVVLALLLLSFFLGKVEK